MNFRAIHLKNGSAMHGEQVQVMPGKDGQKLIKQRGAVKTDARFYRKLYQDRIAQSSENRVHFLRLSQQSAARAFAIDYRGGAAEVQIDGSNRVLLQRLGSAHQGGNIVSD